MSNLDFIAANLESLRRRIAAAAQRAGRSPQEITLVAVSKTFPAEAVRAAYLAGVRHFGENRVEEGREKIPPVNAWAVEQGGDVPTWHMIGHLQSRKAEEAVDFFQVIHSVDGVKLARRLERFCAQRQVTMPILLEVNVSGEQSKYGLSAWDWADDRAQREELFAAVAEIGALAGLRLQGLMTVAPIVAAPEEARPYFQKLRALRDALAERFPGVSWAHLSMGMTDDFEPAVEEGATLLRIGRAIFGERTL